MSQGWTTPAKGGNRSLRKSLTERSCDKSLRRSSLCSLFSIASDGAVGVDSGMSVDSTGLRTRGSLDSAEDDALFTHAKFFSSTNKEDWLPLRAPCEGGAGEGLDFDPLAESKASLSGVFPPDRSGGSLSHDWALPFCNSEGAFERYGKVDVCEKRGDDSSRVSSWRVPIFVEDLDGSKVPNHFYSAVPTVNSGASRDDRCDEWLPHMKQAGSPLVHDFPRCISDRGNEWMEIGEVNNWSVGPSGTTETVSQSGNSRGYGGIPFVDAPTGACLPDISVGTFLLRMEDPATQRGSRVIERDKLEAGSGRAVAARDVAPCGSKLDPTWEAVCSEPFERRTPPGPRGIFETEELAGCVSALDKNEQWGGLTCSHQPTETTRQCEGCFCELGRAHGESGSGGVVEPWSCISRKGNRMGLLSVKPRRRSRTLEVQPCHASGLSPFEHATQPGEGAFELSKVLCGAHVAECTEPLFCDDRLRHQAALKLRSAGGKSRSTGLVEIPSLFPPNGFTCAADTSHSGDAVAVSDAMSNYGVQGSAVELPREAQAGTVMSSSRFSVNGGRERAARAGEGKDGGIGGSIGSPTRRTRREGRRRRRQTELFTQRTGSATVIPEVTSGLHRPHSQDCKRYPFEGLQEFGQCVQFGNFAHCPSCPQLPLGCVRKGVEKSGVRPPCATEDALGAPCRAQLEPCGVRCGLGGPHASAAPESPKKHTAHCTLIVNVPTTTTRSALHDAFSQFGIVEQETVVCGEKHRHPNKEWTATKGKECCMGSIRPAVCIHRRYHPHEV